MPTVAEHLPLRLDDVRVPGSDDHVDWTQRSRAECHRRDRLRAADRVDLVDLRDRGRGQDGVVDVPVGAGRRTQHDFGNAGDAGRQRGHQHRRRERRAPAGHVAARPDRPATTCSVTDTPRRSCCGSRSRLRLVPRDDLVAGELERGAEPG